MGRAVLILLILLTTTSVYGADKFNVRDVVGWKVIGVEQQHKGSFNNIIGRLEFDQGREESLSFVYFMQLNNDDAVTILADRFVVNKKNHVHKKLIYLEGVNRYGVSLKGTVEVKDDNSSKIIFQLSTGSSITNLTDKGKKFKEKYLPLVEIGFFK